MQPTLDGLCGQAQNEPRNHGLSIAEELEHMGFSNLKGYFKQPGEKATHYLFPERFNTIKGTFLLELPNTENSHFEELMDAYHALTSSKSHRGDDIGLFLTTMGSVTGGIGGVAIGMGIGKPIGTFFEYSAVFGSLIAGHIIGAIGTYYAVKKTKANIRQEEIDRISNGIKESYLPRMSKSAKPFDYEILGQVPKMPAFISF